MINRFYNIFKGETPHYGDIAIEQELIKRLLAIGATQDVEIALNTESVYEYSCLELKGGKWTLSVSHGEGEEIHHIPLSWEDGLTFFLYELGKEDEGWYKLPPLKLISSWTEGRNEVDLFELPNGELFEI